MADVLIKSPLLKQEILHYPTLRTILQIEDILKNSEKALSREAIKRVMGGKIMHQTLNIILHYLADSGKIYIGKKGIIWIYNPDKKLDKVIEEGVEH